MANDRESEIQERRVGAQTMPSPTMTATRRPAEPSSALDGLEESSAAREPVVAADGHVPDVAAPVDVNPFAQGRAPLTLGLVLTIVAVAFQALAIATVLPAVVADLGGLNLYGWAFSAFLLTQLVGIVVSGLLGDEHGPALPFALGVLFFSIGLLIGGAAPSMPVLIAGRALQGFGGGAIISAAYVAIGRGYPASARPRMLALLSTGWVVPGLIGPAISGLMAQALGWRAVFFVLAPLPILAALLAIPNLRQIPIGTPHPAARARVLNAVALAAGTGLLLAGVGAGNPPVAVPLVAVGLALAVPAVRHLLPAGTLRAAPGMPAAVATMALINLAFFGIDAFVPLALVEVRGASIAFAGLALTAGTISWTSGSWLQARTAARVPRRKMERIGLSLIAVAIVITAGVLFPLAPLALGPIGWGVSGLGMGLSYITLNVTMLELAVPGQEGNASSSMQLASVLGSGLGTGLGGAIIALVQTQGGPVQRALLLHFALMLGAVLVAFVAARGLPSFLPGSDKGQS
jgi:MFS family permease